MRSVLITLPLALLAGCASTCHTETFYKPEITGPSTISTSWTNYQVFVTAEAGFTFSIFECGTAYRHNTGSPKAICLNIFLDEGRQVVLETSDVTVTNANGSQIDIGTAKIKLPNTYPEQATTITLNGGKDHSRPALSRTLSSLEGWKRYLLTVELPEFISNEFSIELPHMKLNGQPLATPIIRFKKVTENVCHTSV